MSTILFPIVFTNVEFCILKKQHRIVLCGDWQYKRINKNETLQEVQNGDHYKYYCLPAII